jgi:hypothetical protein
MSVTGHEFKIENESRDGHVVMQEEFLGKRKKRNTRNEPK